jgi:hypothetical protein
MNPTVTHRGRTYSLSHHPAIAARLKAGTITLAQAAAAPWYIRLTRGGKRILQCLSTHVVEDARRNALDVLRAADGADDRFAAYRRAVAGRATRTLAPILTAYGQAKCPDRHLAARSGGTLLEAQRRLERLQTWWGGKNLDGLTPRDFDRFLSDRLAASGDGSGRRTAELDCMVLVNALTWAVRMGHLEVNPLPRAPKFRDPRQIDHHRDHMPASDEELHQTAAHLLASPATVVHGAAVLFLALTGLRAGELSPLRWSAGYASGAPRPGQRVRVQLPTGPLEMLAVQREKGGINPAVIVHPALANFLEAWREYTSSTWPGVDIMFPEWPRGGTPGDPTTARPVIAPGGEYTLQRTYAAAATALGLGRRTCHGLRAYFVRCQRAQGQDDAYIANQLGQGSGPALIVRIYGEPSAIRGDRRYDWLPTTGAPAWSTLISAQPTKVIPFQS